MCFQFYHTIMRIKHLSAAVLLLLSCTATLSSCSKDDDNDSGSVSETSCTYCAWRESLNSFCTINGVRYHTGTTSPQYLGTERGSYMTTNLHKDNGTLAISDFYNVDINLSQSSGSSINNMTVGQKLLLENGTDKVQVRFCEDIGKEKSHDKYISGSITCTAKSGSLVTLTLSDVVLENTSDNSRVTVNGYLIYDGAKE